jgi:hypothetical protein
MKSAECAFNGDIRFSGSLSSVEWGLVTEISGKPIDVILMG